MYTQEIVAIYKLNRFKTTWKNIEYDFSMNDPEIVMPDGVSFAILTASNPLNKVLTGIENKALNSELFKEIIAMEYDFHEAVGYLNEHYEESYCIYGIPFDKALELGKKYNQFAIFFSSKNEFDYYISDGQKLLIQS